MATKENSPLPAICEELQAELSNLQPRSTRRPGRQFVMFGAAMAVYAVVVTLSLQLRADWVELPGWWQLGMAGLWIAGLLVPTALLIIPRDGQVGGHWRAASMVALTATALFCGVSAMVHPSGPSSFSFASTPMRGHGCLEMGLGIAMAPAIIVAFLLRGVYPTTSRIVAGSIGAAAGSIGGLVLHFHCRVTDGLHLVLFHGGMVVTAAFVVAVAAPLLLDLPWNYRNHRNRHTTNSKAA